MNYSLLHLVMVALLLAIPILADAQVHDPGPSDPTLFDTVINLPPDPDLGDSQSIGGVADQTTQLNVMDGGRVAARFDANSGSEVNISGGSVGRFLDANSGSEVNISGGTVGDEFEAHSGSVVDVSGGAIGSIFEANSGSEVKIRGGSVGPRFRAAPGSDVELLGGEFSLNGSTFTDSTITFMDISDVFAGTLADGSTFIFSPELGDTLSGVTLTPTALPALDPTPIFVDGTVPRQVTGLRAGQTLTLQDGGRLSNFESIGGTLNIEGGSLFGTTNVINTEVNISGGGVSSFRAFSSLFNITGGTVGDGFEARPGSEVNIRGGTVGDNFEMFEGSTVNISGGTVGDNFETSEGSVVTISGGSVGDFFDANSGSEVNISGGTIGIRFDAHSGSEVNISGGKVVPSILVAPGSDVELLGGEFNLNGSAFTGATIVLGEGDVFAGTLTDGSTFVFGPEYFQPIGFTLTRTALPAINAEQILVDAAFTYQLCGLRAGQTLTLQEGGQLGDHFMANGGTLNVEGGTLTRTTRVVRGEVNIMGGSVGSRFQALVGTQVNISEGSVGDFFEARSGSEVDISGGTVGLGFEARSGSVVNISGGTVGSAFEAFSGSEVNIAGGSIGFHELGGFFEASSGSVVNISGGSVDGSLLVSSGSEINVFGTDFLLDGTSLESLDAGEAFTITERDVTLSGLLADGTPFSFDLTLPPEGTPNFLLEDLFAQDATLTVTLILEGDFNFDGNVDGDDVDFYIGSLGQPATGELAKLDLDNDGVVTLADHNLHVSTLVTTSNGVTGAFLGDVDLDGSVDVLNDAFALVGSLGQSATSRAQGDLNADGVVNVLRDAFILIGDLGMSTN